MVKSRDSLVGAYAFLIGVIFAVLLGLFQKTLGIQESNIPYAILVILGLILGSLKLGDKDTITFLIASLALVIVSGFGQSALIYISTVPILSSLSRVLNALMIMFVPATIVVALKTVFSIAKV